QLTFQVVYYKLPDGHLYHWVIDAHGAKDTVDSLRAHLEKWIKGAEFVDARIEKWNLPNRDTANYHEQLRWAHFLTRDATRIETSDGHLMSCIDDVWYAYPCDGVMRKYQSAGGHVIREDPNTVSPPKKFKSAIEAYQACLEAAGYFDKIAEAEQRQREA